MTETRFFKCKKCGKITTTTNDDVFENEICFSCRNEMANDTIKNKEEGE